MLWYGILDLEWRILSYIAINLKCKNFHVRPYFQWKSESLLTAMYAKLRVPWFYWDTQIVSKNQGESWKIDSPLLCYPLQIADSAIIVVLARWTDKTLFSWTTSKGGKKGWPKIYYATQIAVNPITILMFVNRPELFEENYRRFIINRLRSIQPIDEVPIRLFARKHRQ